MQDCNPKISIIIPVYNIARWLESCLQSVLGQTFSALEVIAVNDGSTDTSLSVLENFARQDKRLKIITQPNQGPAAARYTGIQAAQGKWILFVDGDDLLAPDYCEKLYEASERFQADLVLASVKYVGEEELLPALPQASREPQLLNPLNRKLLWENFLVLMPLWGKLIARSLAGQVTWQKSRYADDIFPSVQLLVSASQIAVQPLAVYCYRKGREDSKSKVASHLFEGLFNDLLHARQFLESSGSYQRYAPCFEYMRRVCLLSFIEKYGISKPEEKLVQEHSADLKVPPGIFKNRPYKFRLRQWLFDVCLSCHLSYAAISRFIRRITGHG